MKKKVLLSKPLHLPPEAEAELKKAVDVIISPDVTEKAMLPLVREVHGIIAHGAGVTREMILSAHLLQVIATPQVGFDKIDLTAANLAGIPVVTNSGLSSGTVAEFTLGLMIALSRRIVKSDYELRQQKDWAVRLAYVGREIGFELQGVTLGLVGFGSIGSALATLTQKAFSTRVLAYDPFISREKMASCQVEKRDSLLELVREADFLSLHVTLTDKTRHLINEDILRAMKPGAYLINCARGEIVDEQALVKALQEKWIGGAATDVFAEEPVSRQNPLLSLPNVIVTPHIAGISSQSSLERGTQAVKRMLQAFAGQKPEGLVNPEVWERYLEKLKSKRI
jgi:D-3-phosphoglycerate dehydrogenase / 2-oxoglutarate reductase